MATTPRRKSKQLDDATGFANNIATSGNRLIDLVKKDSRPQRMPFWLERLPAHKQRQLAELRDAWDSGELLNADGIRPTISGLHRLCQEELKFEVARQTFQAWLTRQSR